MVFLSKIQAGDAWDISKGDTSVWIGIVDCGVQVTHPDLAANIWINPVEDINHNGYFDNWPSTYDSIGEFGDIDSLDNDGNGYKDDVHGWDLLGRISPSLTRMGIMIPTFTAATMTMAPTWPVMLQP